MSYYLNRWWKLVTYEHINTDHKDYTKKYSQELNSHYHFEYHDWTKENLEKLLIELDNPSWFIAVVFNQWKESNIKTSKRIHNVRRWLETHKKEIHELGGQHIFLIPHNNNKVFIAPSYQNDFCVLYYQKEPKFIPNKDFRINSI